MAKRRRGSKSGDLLVLLWAAVLVAFGYPPGDHLFVWIVLVVAVGLVWVSLVMPTKCGYVGRQNKPCDRGVRGKLHACRHHARRRRDNLPRHRARSPRPTPTAD